MAEATLVADYGSSDSDSENEQQSNVTKEGKRGMQLSAAGVNLLSSTAVGDRSDSDSDAEITKKPVAKHGIKNDNEGEESKLLPLPLPGLLGIEGNEAPSSIFANPFEEAEQQKLSILEQHVKLTSAQHKEAELGGTKKICWKFRNGKCCFGHKCKFAHDSDVPATLVSSHNNSDELPGNSSGSNYGIGHSGHVEGGYREGVWLEDRTGEAGDDEQGAMKRKRRPGLSQTLVPSKKVMKSYNRQRNQESPWSQHT